MRGFRSKFILLLIVYFAGFATAIYTLEPVPDNENAADSSQHSFAASALKSDEFARDCSRSLHKCADFLKEITCRAGDFIKEKIEERRQGS